MKSLKEYFLNMPKEERIEFVERCKTSYSHIEKVIWTNRAMSPELAINIERESNGVVRCETLCPDVDWAFIRGTEKAA